MAKRGFASSIVDSLEGRSTKKEPKKMVDKKVKNKPTLKNEAKTPVMSISVPKEEKKGKEEKAKIRKEEKELVVIGFNISKEDSTFVRRSAIKNGLSKEAFFSFLFKETLSYKIDYNDETYLMFTERFKKEARYTTRIEKELYDKVKENAMNNYLKINGYINYVIRRYRLEHE